jgi:hypothetical protein
MDAVMKKRNSDTFWSHLLRLAPEKLETQNAETLRGVRFLFHISLLHFPSGWRANHELRTRRERRGCKRCVPCAGLGLHTLE